ncbi:MAG TPA: type II toxin-antitoxin system VapC family toxin [Candidatus Acidoferrum sp.]|nr:type II toxin-antitoxin system VapC family toxin [Candidatus Acidoferrum sp.]
MAARFLLDTNICIYIRQKRPPEVLARFERLKVGDAGLSVITYGELYYGAAKSPHRLQAMEKLDHLMNYLSVLPLPDTAANSYGEIRAALEAKGQTLGGNDLWIAAHAKAAGLILVTNNEKEFKRVPGLKVQNWAAA